MQHFFLPVAVSLSCSPAIPNTYQEDSDDLMATFRTVHFPSSDRLCVLYIRVINPRSCHMERVNEA